MTAVTGPHAVATAAIRRITVSAFPTPALAVRTADAAEVTRVYGFAEHQAAAARTIATSLVRHLAAAATPDDVVRAVIIACSAATAWRYELAVATGERRRGSGLELTADRFRTPITDADPNYDRLGYVGRTRVGSTWDARTRTYTGGTATPAHHTLALYGQRAAERFAAERPRNDVLQNLVQLDNGSLVLGNRLLRRTAAARAATELVARIAARGADVSRIETGGDPIYTATATARDRAHLRQAAITTLADALRAAADGDATGAARHWAHAAYLLYQSPQTKKGSDAIHRVTLIALGTVALRRIPPLPSDIDLRAYVLGQHTVVDDLLVRLEAPVQEVNQ